MISHKPCMMFSTTCSKTNNKHTTQIVQYILHNTESPVLSCLWIRNIFVVSIEQLTQTLLTSISWYFFRCLCNNSYTQHGSLQVSYFLYDALCSAEYKYKYKKVKVFPYSLLSVGPRDDPDVQAVSLQVSLSHPPGNRLPLLSARPAVTFPAEECHCP